MKRFGAGVVVALLLVLVAVPAALASGPFIEYQEVVVIEPIGAGGGGGAFCFWRHTYRESADGTMTHISVERVCI